MGLLLNLAKQLLTLEKEGCYLTNENFLKIIENEKKFSELASKQFSDKQNISRDNIKEILDNRGAEIRALIAETNVIIEEHLSPLLKNPEAMTATQADELEELASRLSGYKESIDTGLSYEIRHALSIYAKSIGDDERYIANTFYKGLTLFYLESHLFRKDMQECYNEVTSFGDRYAEFDRVTRNLIVRAYGNSYISVPDRDIKETFSRYDRAEDFWRNVAMEVDPDFPWDAYFKNLHDNLCATCLTALRNGQLKKDDEYYVKRFHESAMYVYNTIKDGKILESNDYTAAETKTLYYLYSAEYYNGFITAKELSDFLYNVYKQADNEYTYTDLYKKLHITALYFNYVALVPEEDLSKTKRNRIAKEIENDVYSYVSNIPETLSRSHVTSMLTNFATGSHSALEDFAYLKLLLSLTVFRHPPTYVHSVMVAKIAFTIVEFIAKHHPEKLIGLPSINSIEDVNDNIGELLLFVWFSGLIHDIGKIVYSHMVSFYVRKLNDKEFEMIKQHTSKAKAFIKTAPDFSSNSEITEQLKYVTDIKFNNNQELFAHFADIALGHHKSYDGKFGYPYDFDNLNSPVKLIIDVITVADSIDAATDSVGRSYASEKTLSHLKDDLLSQIGNRYSPFVAEIVFNNQELYNSIEEILTDYRYSIYYSCFETQDFSLTMMPPKATLF